MRQRHDQCRESDEMLPIPHEISVRKRLLPNFESIFLNKLGGSTVQYSNMAGVTL